MLHAPSLKKKRIKNISKFPRFVGIPSLFPVFFDVCCPIAVRLIFFFQSNWNGQITQIKTRAITDNLQLFILFSTRVRMIRAAAGAHLQLVGEVSELRGRRVGLLLTYRIVEIARVVAILRVASCWRKKNANNPKMHIRSCEYTVRL